MTKTTPISISYKTLLMIETSFLTQAPTIRSVDVSIVLVKQIKHNPLTVIHAHLTQDKNACKETKNQNNEG